MVSDERIAEIKRRCEWATSAPWSVVTDGTESSVEATGLGRFVTHLNSNMHRYRDDAEFIAHARQDVPDLLDALAAAQAEIAALKAALTEACHATEHMLEFFKGENPGPGIRDDHKRWCAILAPEPQGSRGGEG